LAGHSPAGAAKLAVDAYADCALMVGAGALPGSEAQALSAATPDKMSRFFITYPLNVQ
jgi:hypothetical protein